MAAATVRATATPLHLASAMARLPSDRPYGDGSAVGRPEWAAGPPVQCSPSRSTRSATCVWRKRRRGEIEYVLAPSIQGTSAKGSSPRGGRPHTTLIIHEIRCHFTSLNPCCPEPLIPSSVKHKRESLESNKLMMADIFFQSESFISIDSTKPRKKVTATFRHVVRPRRRGVHLWLNLDRRTERRCTHARTSTLKRSSAAQVEEFVLSFLSSLARSFFSSLCSLYLPLYTGARL